MKTHSITRDINFVSENLIVVTAVTTLDSSEAYTIPGRKKCHNVAPFPVYLRNTTGSLVGSRMVVCGGKHSTGYFNTSCYSLGPQEQSWRHDGNLKLQRVDAASIAVGDKIFVTGKDCIDKEQAIEAREARERERRKFSLAISNIY